MERLSPQLLCLHGWQTSAKVLCLYTHSTAWPYQTWLTTALMEWNALLTCHNALLSIKGLASVWRLLMVNCARFSCTESVPSRTS